MTVPASGDAPAPQKARVKWAALRPVPADAPPPPGAHYARGRPVGLHAYRDESGVLMGYVADFVRSNGTPLQLPLAYCEDVADGRTPHRREWRWRWFAPLRPLFPLDRLSAPGADNAAAKPVLLLHDEFNANAAAGLLQAQYDCLTWPGGGRQIDEADWAPLKYRHVVVWLPSRAERFKVGAGDPLGGHVKPLHLQPHYGAIAKLVEIFNRLECRVDVVLVHPGAHADGFCVAGAIAGGMSARDILAFIALESSGTGARIDSAATLRLRVALIDESVPLPGAKHVSTPVPAPAGEVVDALAGTTAEAGGEPLPPDEKWLSKLIRDAETARILPEVHNLRMILQHHARWRGIIFQDDFAHRIMKKSAPPYEGGRAGEFSDADDVMVRGWLASELNILRVKKTDVPDAVLAVAALNRVNPLHAYLNGLKWDGKSRLRDWLITYLGAGVRAHEDDTAADMERKDASPLMQYLRLVGPMWLVGAVKRAFVPGCKFDYVLILEGEQGKGKSSALAILAREFGMDSPISFTHKDGAEALQGKWIVELPELDSFSKADSTTSKSFFTRPTDRYRLPYAKRSADFARTCVFAGTTNEGEYFRDATGNRRYWSAHVGWVDRAALERDRDQLIAEAVVMFRQGAPVFPTYDQERDLIRPEQRKRMVQDPWVLMLEEWLTTRAKDRLTMADILVNGLKLDPGKVDENRMAMRVGRAMRELGFEKREGRNGPQRFWYEKAGSADA